MAATELLLIRHGESTWNAEGRWQGQANPPLSERGRAQAQDATARLAGEEIHALVVSDLARARQTGEILARGLGLVPRFEPRIREFDVGEWSGLTPAEIAERWPEDLAALRGGELDVRPGGGESWRELQLRVRGAVDEIARVHRGRRVALVTHLGVIRTLVPGVRLGHLEISRIEHDAG